MGFYDHKKIEGKWQNEWDKKKVYQAQFPSKKPKFYSLIEFPYPSGDGLHVGHPRPYIGMDVISRQKRMQGFNVLYPIGWDAFGLPTENYAIKTGLDPRVVTKKNTDTFRRQIKSIGISFDWSREINTTDPKYYKWTQWIFLQFLKKGLAYKAKMTVNWCPSCKTGLANEEVVAGACERCGTKVEKRKKEQWMLAITKYAERLDKDLDLVDYLPQIKLSQRNWIGKSLGAEIDFRVSEHSVKVFTTRPDTIYGATYLVLAPEHELVSRLKPKISNWDKVAMYILESKSKTDIDRTKEDKEKTGVELKGIKATNPATGEDIPVWVADYVLAHYGTGAIMAVPAHDERDFEFAKKFDLPIKQVVMPSLIDLSNPPVEGKENTFRNVVLIALLNPKTKKYLTLRWKTQPWISFVTGGVEDGENREEAAKREITEETGYKNFRLVRSLGMGEAFFFAAHKDVNRKVHREALLFELVDEAQEEVSQEEKNQYDLEWLTIEQLEKTKMAHAEADSIINSLKTGKDFYDGDGVLLNSGRFDGQNSEEAKKQIINFVGGKEKITFKLRDWIFSRQRYWGEPIPVIHCPKCGLVPVPEKDLPVELPRVKNYQPTDSGESPLANVSKWVNVKCPNCKGSAKRETDTMPNWAGSSWYYLRYADHENDKAFADPKNLKYWTPVDWYNGGNEHTTLHLLYSRFWHKFLYDLKLVPTPEPYLKRTSHGIILADGGEKMSKSKGNVVNPDDIVSRYGADTLRLYEMFMGPFDQAIAWSEEAIIGPRRFLERVWKVASQVKQNFAALPGGKKNELLHFSSDSQSEIADASLRAGDRGRHDIIKLLHKTIKKVSVDIESMHFNTAISTMMILATEMEKSGVDKEEFKKFLQILAPFAPHITEELWKELGEKKSIHMSAWPQWDPELVRDEEVKIAVQVNGKVRGEITVPADASEDEVKNKALNEPAISKHLGGSDPKKIIYIKGRLINIVT